jgi:hypothetical protein
MTDPDDPTEDMASPHSPDSVDRLLSGAPALGDPAAADEVRHLLTALRSPTASDGAGEQEAVVSIAAAVRAAPVRLDAAKGTRLHSRRISARAAGLAAALVLVGGTAAAATTGSLPDAAQSTVARALSHVSIDVPNPDAHASDHASHQTANHPHGTEAGTAVGPDTAGAANQGLCTAWAARNRAGADTGNSATATSFTNLRHAAHADGQLVKDFCAEVLAGRSDTNHAGTERGQAGDQGQAGDDHDGSNGSPGRSGASDHGSPVTSPNSGGVDTGTTASDGANSTGTDHAASEAIAGSENAPTHPTSSFPGGP